MRELFLLAGGAAIGFLVMQYVEKNKKKTDCEIKLAENLSTMRFKTPEAMENYKNQFLADCNGGFVDNMPSVN